MYAFPATLALGCNVLGDLMAIVVYLVSGEEIVFHSRRRRVGLRGYFWVCGILQFDGWVCRRETRRLVVSVEEVRHDGGGRCLSKVDIVVARRWLVSLLVGLNRLKDLEL